MSSGVVPLDKIIGPKFKAKPYERKPDASDVGGFRSKGRTNSPRAKAKAKKTRLDKSRAKANAARAARVLQEGTAGAAAVAMVAEMRKHAPMSDDLARRFETYLTKHPRIALVVGGCAPVPEMTAQDYRDKVPMRAEYLTSSTPRLRRQ